LLHNPGARLRVRISVAAALLLALLGGRGGHPRAASLLAAQLAALQRQHRVALLPAGVLVLRLVVVLHARQPARARRVVLRGGRRAVNAWDKRIPPQGLARVCSLARRHHGAGADVPCPRRRARRAPDSRPAHAAGAGPFCEWGTRGYGCARECVRAARQASACWGRPRSAQLYRSSSKVARSADVQSSSLRVCQQTGSERLQQITLLLAA